MKLKDVIKSKNEIWKDIQGYEGLYQISNLGRIKSLYKRGNRPPLIIRQPIKRGYYQVGLRNKRTRKFFQVHRLVAQAFIPNPENLPQINHKDENKLNNVVENLEWCSVSYNNAYGTRLSRVAEKTGKPVMQYTLDGEFIKEYPSLSEAARQTKSRLSGISMCCAKKYSNSNGYLWIYKNQ